jgi:hypothetical protein
MKVALLLCYGLFETTNQEYKDYVDLAAREVTEKNIEKLIICGGYTNPQKDISEAESVFNYLKSTYNLSCQIIQETKSLTTPQNLQFSAPNIDPIADTILIYCDLYRLAKVIWLSAHFFLGKSKEDISNALLDYRLERKITPFSKWNLTIIPFDFPSRDKYEAFGQSFSTLLEVEAIYDLNLDERIVDERRKKFGVK